MDVAKHPGGPRALRDFYPEIAPFESGRLQVSPLHNLYWEQSGKLDGVPVLFLHGGPGAGAGPIHRRFFDPNFYRIVIFDQRGAGRSTPRGCLEDNTTPRLIEDIERLRETLDIEQWLVFGGSWGSTLALAYAQAYPERCRALILRGIFLCRPSEIDWFLYGLRTLFPEAWNIFATHIPPAERDNLLLAYHRRLTDPDPAVYRTAARIWSAYEGMCSTLLPNQETVAAFAHEQVALGLARIEAHYFVNNIFLPLNALLDGIPRIRHIPGFIVQGRYDAVCPIITAHELASAWPEAQYQIVDDAGHSAFEPGIRSALIEIMDQYRDRYSL